jgi:folate-binding protein YgfZ
MWLELERSQWPAVRAHLEKLLVADDVELEGLGSLAALDIEGPKSPEVVERTFGNGIGAIEPWHHLESEQFRIANVPRYGGPAFTIIGERSAITATAERISQTSPEVHALTAASLEVVRLEHGLARVGVDTSERTLALEARLERAISFNKGCYVGQETIERATARGALKRRLCGLRISGSRIPSPGASITLEGKEVGRLTSVAHSPAAGVIGLAILHHSAWSPGIRVALSDDSGTVDGSVTELPFALGQASSGEGV